MIPIPVWLVMVAVALVVLTRRPLLPDAAFSGGRWMAALQGAGLWIVWVVFLLAFAPGAAAGHLSACNLPALVLYLAAALGWFLPRLQRGSRTPP